MALTVIGLGYGPVDHLSLKAWKMLENASAVYLKTRAHPCVPDLPHTPAYFDFDSEDEAAVTGKLLEVAANTGVVYAVPGDPLTDDPATLSLIEAAHAANIDIEIIRGAGRFEWAARQISISDGLQMFSGAMLAEMYHPPLNPDFPAIITGMTTSEIISGVKRTLLNQYPVDFSVRWLGDDGSTVTLGELDQSQAAAGVLHIPALGHMTSFEAFQEVIAHLRAPDGCPWDRKQTHQTLRPYLLEETYEVLEALDAGDPAELASELGDLMLQIVLHTQVAIDNGTFNMTDVMRKINEKMIRRHPHVWGDVDVNGDPDKVLANWDTIKKAENGDSRESILDGIPKALPALMVAHKYQAKAAKVGFDWPDVSGVTDKIREELQEIAHATSDADKIDEIGDVIFVLVNWLRWLGVDDPESVLRATNAKFYRRFRYIEDAVARAGVKPLNQHTLAEMDALWDQAKTKGL